MMWELNDLAGVQEIAKRIGVRSSTVINWSHRHAGFPEPLTSISSRNVYSMRQVLAWYEAWVVTPSRNDWPKGPLRQRP